VQGWRRIFRAQEFGVFLVLIAMSAILGLTTNTFLTPYNLGNIMLNFSWIAIAAFGMTMVIITGGIDLSVGSVMALAGLTTAMLLGPEQSLFAHDGIVSDWVIPVAILAGLGVGAICGFINGMLITVAGLPPFIATLGMLQMARGITQGWAQGWPVQNLPANFMIIGRQNFFIGQVQFPLPTIIMGILGIVVWLFLTRTLWGYRIFATGGNEQAAQLSGISTKRVKLMVYTLAGLLGGAGGVLMTSRLGVAMPTAAMGYELDVIAAVVVGGTSMTGGEGSILGTLIGAAIMGVLRTGLNLLRVEAYWLPAAQGLIIVAAISLDQWMRRRRGTMTNWKQIFLRWFR
jgi:ribose transport system permease protein